MTDYTHLSMRDRCLIATFLSMNTKVKIIAERSNRHRSTIYREIKRNKHKPKDRYMPGLAHQMAIERHPHAPNKLVANKDLNKYVLDGLNNSWSPEQIVGRIKIEKKPFSTCPESIYRYVYRDKKKKLFRLLPRKKSKRKVCSKRSMHERTSQMDRRNISLRPAEAACRSNAGHWEGDTIRFERSQKTCVTTLAERKSRLVILLKNKDKKSETVINKIYQKINLFPKKQFASLTFDQGTEFSSFLSIERLTKCKIYFCDPHSPWQRPTNENTNGRVRRFLPKKFHIDKINQRQLDKIADNMNNTPRKCLGYLTPTEVFMQHQKAICRTPP